MKRIVNYLSQVNTWAALTILAIAGWLLNSLFWFLETHSLTVAGVVTYLAHSWYVLLLLGAIFIILHLRRSAELLSLTIYDEQGAPIHHQGDFPLEANISGPIFASFKGTIRATGLHCLELPTGSTIYFLHQGGLIIVAIFSGAVRPHQLKGMSPLERKTELVSESLLCDLPIDVAALAAYLLNASVERDLLTYLWRHPQVAMTAADLAGMTGYGEDEVTKALTTLEQLSLICRQQVSDITFYRLTADEIWLGRLERFIAWRGDWLAHAQRVEQFVGPAK